MPVQCSSMNIFSFLETKNSKKKLQAWGWVQIGMGNSQIRLLKCFSTIWEGSKILKLYSVEVCFYQTCVTLEEN